MVVVLILRLSGYMALNTCFWPWGSTQQQIFGSVGRMYPVLPGPATPERRTSKEVSIRQSNLLFMDNFHIYPILA
jgi:hypothetical protein